MNYEMILCQKSLYFKLKKKHKLNFSYEIKQIKFYTTFFYCVYTYFANEVSKSER